MQCLLLTIHSLGDWANRDGQVNNIRTHLKKYHHSIYESAIVEHRLYQPKKKDDNDDEYSESWTMEGFYQRLISWWTVTSQVSIAWILSGLRICIHLQFAQAVNMIECPELRSLFLYMCPQLRDHGLIHRTALTQKIKDTYKAVHLDNIETFFKVWVPIMSQLHIDVTIGLSRKDVTSTRPVVQSQS